MGMYTGVRFKGYVKPKYRIHIDKIVNQDDGWENSDILAFRDYGQCSRCHFIPFGALAYMPDKWETEPYNKYGDGIPTDGFNRTFNIETGYWAFQCSLKNYEGTIESFFELIPLFIEKLEHLEYFYEEMEYSRRYDLVDGKIICVNNKFIKYIS